MKPLVAVFLAAEVADLATYLQAPHLEANPIMAALPPLAVAVVKLGGAALAVAVASRLRPAAASLALGLGIAIAAFGFGANVATLAAR